MSEAERSAVAEAGPLVIVSEKGRSLVPASTAALAAAQAYAREALAPETLRAYAADWAHFCGWCSDTGCAPLPAEPAAVAAYLASLAGLYSRSLLKRRLAAIGQQHRLRGLNWSAGHPAIHTTLRGIFRRHGSRRRQAAALTSSELRKLVAACGGDLWLGSVTVPCCCWALPGRCATPSWSASTASICASPARACA